MPTPIPKYDVANAISYPFFLSGGGPGYMYRRTRCKNDRKDCGITHLKIYELLARFKLNNFPQFKVQQSSAKSSSGVRAPSDHRSLRLERFLTHPP